MDTDLIRTFLENNAEHAEEYHDKLAEVQDGQAPGVVSVSCGDSRVLQDMMAGNDELSWLFTYSNIGNTVFQEEDGSDVVAGDFIYPVAHNGTQEMVVVGHTGCGAVTATYNHLVGASLADEPAGIRGKVEDLAERLQEGFERLPDGDDATRINWLVEYNVDRQVAFVRERLAEELSGTGADPDDVDVYGMVYDLEGAYDGRNGELHLINVNGDRDPSTLREEYPALAERVDRLWEY